MGLKMLDPPEAAAKTACDILGALRSGPGFQTRGPLSRCRSQVHIAAPHPVFNLPLEALDADKPFEAAAMTGWQYLVVSHSAALATVELRAPNRYASPTFCRLTDGPMAKSAARWISKAEKSSVVRNGRYALGMIRTPAIHIHALWLRHELADGTRDLFALLEPAPFGMDTTHFCSPQRFLDFLRQRREMSAHPTD